LVLANDKLTQRFIDAYTTYFSVDGTLDVVIAFPEVNWILDGANAFLK
jgi:hypothetical protein